MVTLWKLQSSKYHNQSVGTEAAKAQNVVITAGILATALAVAAGSFPRLTLFNPLRPRLRSLPWFCISSSAHTVTVLITVAK